MNNDLILKELNKNNVVGYATDTVFALLVKLSKENIAKINILKKRDKDKPVQILFSSLNEVLDLIDDKFAINYLNNNFKYKTSYIVKSKKDFSDNYLKESFNNTFLFRIPIQKELIDLINKSGPLFATSANIHGEEPLQNIEDIKRKFNIVVANIEQKENKPSKIISLLNNKEKIIRS